MLRITKETDYAFLLLTQLIEKSDQVKTAGELSKISGVPIPVTSKILKKLVKYDLLTSVRGVSGGYIMSKNYEDISVLDVVIAIEGLPEIMECADGKKTCQLSKMCQTSDFWKQLNDEIIGLLSMYTLKEVTSSKKEMVEISHG